MFKAVDRASFSAIQQKLFPIYFGLQTVLPGVLALTFPGNTLIGLSNGPAGLVSEFARYHSLLPITLMAVTGALNLTVLLPLTMDVMKQRRGQGMSICVLYCLHLILTYPKSSETERSGMLRDLTQMR